MPQPLTVRVARRDQTWNGTYEVQGKVVRVDSAYGSQARDAGRRNAQVVAQEILADLVDAWCARPKP